jgi:hypothetical protein
MFSQKKDYDKNINGQSVCKNKVKKSVERDGTDADDESDKILNFKSKQYLIDSINKFSLTK